ncbi:MAG: hypothetical protein JJE04_21210 [Acidobacteriia bacterium]|nr:hypothetical protein [Terriglobia bacterium]
MATNWKAIAALLAPDIPAGDLERVTVPLEGLEAQFRPQVARIPLETEPAYLMAVVPEEPV